MNILEIKRLLRNKADLKLKKKKELALIFDMQLKDTELNEIWSDMLIQKKKIKVIKAISEQEVEQKYEEIMNSLNNDGSGRLGSLWSIKDREFIYNDGFIICIIEFVVSGLKSGVDEDSYIKALNESDEFNLKYISYMEKFHNDYD